MIQLERGKRQAESPLTPELREFIDAAIVPILVREFLAAEAVSGQQLAEVPQGVAKFPRTKGFSEGAHP